MHFGLIDLETLPDHFKAVLINLRFYVKISSKAYVIVAINSCFMGLYYYNSIIVHVESSFDKINLAFLL